MNFKEYDIFKLKKDIDGVPVKKGAIGNVLMCFEKPIIGYLVEFCDKDGVTIAEIDLTEDFMESIER